MNGACFIGVEVDPARIRKRIETGYCDRMTSSLDEALAMTSADAATGRGAIGGTRRQLRGRDAGTGAARDRSGRADGPDERARPAAGLRAERHGLDDALRLRETDPDEYVRRSMASMAAHVTGMLELKRRGAVTFDYGNNIRTQARSAGVEDAFEIPGFVPEFIRPLFCEGKGPFRWVALSGDPEDIRRTDRWRSSCFPKTKRCGAGWRSRSDRIHFQGLPARVCWLGYGERARFGVALNELVRRGELKAPIVIGRDHLDTGSVASPYRETEGMRDGSDAIADWPLLNALVNTAAGASLDFDPQRRRRRDRLFAACGHGGGGRRHREMDVRLERVLTTDPGIGVVRHADAGYPEAIAVASRESIFNCR